MMKTARIGSLLLLVGLTGCAEFDLTESLALPGFEPEYRVPERMTDMWVETVLHQTGLTGVRGFGGRLMFYGKKNDEPIRVDGTLVVYAFDDAKQDGSMGVPQKKFVFPAEELRSHYSKSDLGHSYSVWLPWDEVGGPERRIALLARFEDLSGQVVVSKQTLKILPGRQPESVAAPEPSADQRNAIQRVSHEELQTAAPKRRATTIVTIDVPPSFARQTLGSGLPYPDPFQADPFQADEAQAAPSTGPSSYQAPPTVQPEGSLEGTGKAFPPRDRFSRSRYPVRSGPNIRPTAFPAPRTPFPATSLSALPSTPRSVAAGGSSTTGSTARQASHLPELSARE